MSDSRLTGSQDAQARLKENWDQVCGDVRQAAIGSRRDPDEIQIIGVSKYVDAETTGQLVDAGCRALGESRPQQLCEKAHSLALGERVSWHMIGHLQRNKVRRLLRHQPIIHSIDSQRLLASVADEADSQGLEIVVLLEVNISGEAEKTGLEPDSLKRLLGQLPERGVRVEGLMAMAGRDAHGGDARRQFAQTRELRDQLADQFGLPLSQLSMGMSGDFVEAIGEGATMVRIGSRLFDGLRLS